MYFLTTLNIMLIRSVQCHPYPSIPKKLPIEIMSYSPWNTNVLPKVTFRIIENTKDRMHLLCKYQP
jgi:hypothetical protein